MTRESNRNHAASIRARLLSLSQEKGEDYHRVLGRFAVERFLHRLGTSPYRDQFVLKGASLFTLWTGETHRPTKDLDLLGSGSSAVTDIEQVVRAICQVEEDDGILFDSQLIEGVRSKKMMSTTEYGSSFGLSSQERVFLCRLILDLEMRSTRSLSWQHFRCSCRCQRRLFEPIHGSPRLPRSCTPWSTSTFETAE